MSFFVVVSKKVLGKKVIFFRKKWCVKFWHSKKSWGTNQWTSNGSTRPLVSLFE